MVVNGDRCRIRVEGGALLRVHCKGYRMRMWGCREEDGMLWKGVGGRLGVDLCDLLGLEA